jgi:hypothetical protein
MNLEGMSKDMNAPKMVIGCDRLAGMSLLEAQKLLEGTLEGVYAPEALCVIQKAFDEAWRQLARSHADPVGRAEARMKLARIMITLARENITDWEWLKRRSLQLMKSV